MSDRINFGAQYFLGDTVTNPNTDTQYLDYPATSGFSGFPFRQRLVSAFETTYEPNDARFHSIRAPLTFQQAVEVYWRVKTWRVTLAGTGRRSIPDPPFFEDVDYSFSADFDIGTSYSFSPAEGDPDEPDYVPASQTNTPSIFRERDLCQEFATISGDQISEPGTEGLDCIISCSWPNNILSYVMWDDGLDENYTPQSTFYVGGAFGSPSYTMPIGGRRPYTHPYASGNPNVDYHPIGDFLLKLSNDVEINSPDAVFENNNFTTHFSCNITVEATKWWPYRNIAGDPVFDEDTGERIADPRG